MNSLLSNSVVRISVIKLYNNTRGGYMYDRLGENPLKIRIS